jgi:hypothetical protein
LIEKFNSPRPTIFALGNAKPLIADILEGFDGCERFDRKCDAFRYPGEMRKSF